MPTIQVADKPTLDNVNNNLNKIGVYNNIEVKNENQLLSAKVPPLLPYNFQNGTAIVYKDEIHILGGKDFTRNHYKFNFTNQTWTSVGLLPGDIRKDQSAVVFDNKLHIFSETSHYIFNDSNNTWTLFAELPFSFSGIALVIIDGIFDFETRYDIRILQDNTEYKYGILGLDGEKWFGLSELPFTITEEDSAISDGLPRGIHVFKREHHYAYNETNGWEELPNNDMQFEYSKIIYYYNYEHGFELYLIGGINDPRGFYHCSTNDMIWHPVNDDNNIFYFPYDCVYTSAVIYNDNIYVLGGWSNNNESNNYAQFNIPSKNDWKLASEDGFLIEVKLDLGIKYLLTKNTKILCNQNDIIVYQSIGVPSLIDEGYKITEDCVVYIVPTTSDKTKLVYSIL